jgi:hypothetical protein
MSNFPDAVRPPFFTLMKERSKSHKGAKKAVIAALVAFGAARGG